MIEASHKAKSKAYCRYSKFRVGAALLCIDGTIVTGKNLMGNVRLTITITADYVDNTVYPYRQVIVTQRIWHAGLSTGEVV